MNRPFDPYEKLLGERIVLLGTEIDDAAANDVVARLVHLEHQAPDRDISLYVNSPGGSFEAMTAIYDTMRFVACQVATVCLGQAGTAAAVLLAAGAPGRRSMLPGARVLLRRPELPERVEGSASDLAVRAREALRTRALLEEMLGRHTGRGRGEVGEDIERGRVLPAREAVAYGLVDRVAPAGAARPGAPVAG
nr:ATP-dependent Clp protease proteolytic subunit [Streptomyces mangrovisoli]